MNISSELLIAIGIILILIDIFFLSDIAIVIALAIFSFVGAQALEFELIYQIIFGLLFFFLLISLYYLFFKNIIQAIANKWIAPDKHKELTDSLTGKTGVIETVDEKQYVRLDGKLWPFENESKLSIKDGNEVHIKKFKSGNLII